MGTKFTKLKNNLSLSKNGWLVFVVFLMYSFHLSFAALLFRWAVNKLSDFFF